LPRSLDSTTASRFRWLVSATTCLTIRTYSSLGLLPKSQRQWTRLSASATSGARHLPLRGFWAPAVVGILPSAWLPYGSVGILVEVNASCVTQIVSAWLGI